MTHKNKNNNKFHILNTSNFNNIIEEFVISRENQKEKQIEEMNVVIENIKKLGGNTYD